MKPLWNEIFNRVAFFIDEKYRNSSGAKRALALELLVRHVDEAETKWFAKAHDEISVCLT